MIMNFNVNFHFSQSFEHSCGFCNDILHTKADLLDHLKVQHSERCCSYCNEWFVEADELNHHIRYVHADKKLLEEVIVSQLLTSVYSDTKIIPLRL